MASGAIANGAPVASSWFSWGAQQAQTAIEGSDSSTYSETSSQHFATERPGQSDCAAKKLAITSQMAMKEVAGLFPLSIPSEKSLQIEKLFTLSQNARCQTTRAFPYVAALWSDKYWTSGWCDQVAGLLAISSSGSEQNYYPLEKGSDTFVGLVAESSSSEKSACVKVQPSPFELCHRITTWDLTKEEPQKTFDSGELDSSLFITRDQVVTVPRGSRRSLEVWNIRTAVMEYEIPVPSPLSGVPHALSGSSEEGQVALLNNDKLTQISGFDLGNRRFLYTVETPQWASSQFSPGFSPGRFYWQSDAAIQICDIRSGATLHTIHPGWKGGEYHTYLIAKGGLLTIDADQCTIAEWDLQSGELKRKFERVSYPLDSYSICLAKSHLIAVAKSSEVSQLLFFNLESGKIDRSKLYQGQSLSLAARIGGRVIVQLTPTKSALFYKESALGKTMEAQCTLPSNSDKSPVWNNPWRNFFFPGQTLTLEIWDVETLTRAASIQEDFAVGDEDPMIYTFELRPGQLTVTSVKGSATLVHTTNAF